MNPYRVSDNQFSMLRAIDGLPKHRIEFEETCALRTLRRFGVRVALDDRLVMRVDWTTVNHTPGTR